MKVILRQWINFIFVLATLLVNGFANALPLNGQTTGEISDRFRVYFVPAGYVFSIWGLIYVGLVAFALYQLLPAQCENPFLRKIGYLPALSSMANIAWIFLWHYEYFIWTLVAMLSLLFSLIIIYLRLRIGYIRFSAAERWCLAVPFSIYLGWITVATIANITAVLDYLKWNGWGISPQAWTVIMLLAGTAIAATMSLTRGDVAYLLVIAWAFAGIAVKHVDTPLVTMSAWIATALVFFALVIGVILHRRRMSIAT